MRNALNDTAELNLLLTCTSEQTVKTYPGRETKRFFIKKNLSQISIITCVMPSCVERMVSTGAVKVKVITEIIKVKKLPKLKGELRNITFTLQRLVLGHSTPPAQSNGSEGRS